MRTIRQLVDDRAGADPRATFLSHPYRSLARRSASCVIRALVSAMLKRRRSAPGEHAPGARERYQTVRLLLGAMYGGHGVNPVNLLSVPEQMR